jgi:hypothetical protein
MEIQTTSTIISTVTPEKMPVDPSLVKMKVKYPSGYDKTKFYSDGQFIEISDESAKIFEKAKIATRISEAEYLKLKDKKEEQEEQEKEETQEEREQREKDAIVLAEKQKEKDAKEDKTHTTADVLGKGNIPPAAAIKK